MIITSSGKVIGGTNNKLVNNYPTVYDVDAETYFNALSISTNQTMQDGSTLTPNQILVLIDRFFKDLKGISNPNYATSNIYRAFSVIRPYIGGTNTRHKWNAILPVDNDNAFRAIYSGSSTHDAWGIKFNGGDYENSKFNMSTLLNNNFTVGCYISSGVAQNSIILGAHTSTGNGGIIIYPRYGNNNSYLRAASSTERTGGVFSGLGLIQMTSYNSGGDKIRYTENTSIKLDATDTKTSLASLEIWVGGQNNNGALYAPTTFRLGYNFICNRALTITEETNHYNAVQALQTGLKRNI